MTNRLDMIDEALTRPGRLEVHMEISLPDEKGRLQILNIHTAKMKTNGVMDRDVNLPELAAVTKNFSGAEIGGLVKSATSFAFNRHVKVGTLLGKASVCILSVLDTRSAQWPESLTTSRTCASIETTSWRRSTKCTLRLV